MTLRNKAIYSAWKQFSTVFQWRLEVCCGCSACQINTWLLRKYDKELCPQRVYAKHPQCMPHVNSSWARERKAWSSITCDISVQLGKGKAVWESIKHEQPGSISVCTKTRHYDPTWSVTAMRGVPPHEDDCGAGLADAVALLLDVSTVFPGPGNAASG